MSFYILNAVSNSAVKTVILFERSLQRIEAIAPDEPRILVATGRYLGEGFDDSRLDTLFLALR